MDNFVILYGVCSQCRGQNQVVRLADLVFCKLCLTKYAEEYKRELSKPIGDSYGNLQVCNCSLCQESRARIALSARDSIIPFFTPDLNGPFCGESDDG